MTGAAASTGAWRWSPGAAATERYLRAGARTGRGLAQIGGPGSPDRRGEVPRTTGQVARPCGPGRGEAATERDRRGLTGEPVSVARAPGPSRLPRAPDRLAGAPRPNPYAPGRQARAPGPAPWAPDRLAGAPRPNPFAPGRQARAPRPAA
ncbi:hypothetical protein GCM10010299_72900 [Streptomyces tanashiensis]|nr:hypothetical protein GCM10010299_72900 [Streptomyces tanashiensis]